MKKEYLILFALILILGAYLFLHKENRDHYTLPEIKKIDISKITGLVIDKNQVAIIFTKKGKTWVLTDKEYPADSTSVENMLDTLKGLKLSALVALKGNPERYELDDENRIQVKILQGEKTVFEFSIGKTAPTFNHTFVRLGNDPDIYHANGSFRSNFDKTIDDFRDKKVLEFKEDTLKKFILKKDGISKTLTARKDKKDKKTEALRWNFKNGAPADKEAVSDFLSSVSFLKCEKYLKDSEKETLEKETPLCKLLFETPKKIELTLFKTDTQDNIVGVSSMNQYAFALNSFTSKEIISSVEKLLGIEKKKKDKE